MAALHIAFLAVCTYVVVIVFSTTDVDLLIGKGIKLPVVAVDVPIVGFYATAPYLLVLFHFNLLLELQLLSRKLYAFDAAAPQHAGIGGLRDQLNIFPYNYYLVGQPSRLVGFFVSVLVTITILLLPLAALLTLEARFLAYQSEAVTWAQRAAIWLDVGLVAVLWPVIMDRGDSWSAFMKRVWDNVKEHRFRWAWTVAGLAVAVTLLAFPLQPVSRTFFSELEESWVAQRLSELEESWVARALFWGLAGWLLLTLSAPAWRHGFHWLSRGRYFTDSQANPLVAGAVGLLTVLLLGLPLPLIFLVDGETLDLPNAVGTKILNKLQLRNLDLHREVLLAKPARPETIADLRSTDLATTLAAQRSIEPVNLRGRGLRRANFSGALVPMADLAWAELQGASLAGARMQGANLVWAELQGANLMHAQLQGANLIHARLQGASLLGAQLQGADLAYAQLTGAHLISAHMQGASFMGAELQGASLMDARLQGANLMDARLQGASLKGARLQAADLMRAQLQGADLEYAQLKGGDLRLASLYTESLPPATELVDVRGLKWKPLSAKEVEALKKIADNADNKSWTLQNRDGFLKDLDGATATAGLKAPTIELCLLDETTEITCKNSIGSGEFRERMSKELEVLACQSSYIAHGIVARLNRESPDDSVIEGFAVRLQNIRKKAVTGDSCPGLFALAEGDAALLTRLAEPEKR